MRPGTHSTLSARGEWAIAIAMVVGVVLALFLFLGIQEAQASGAARSQWRHCGTVVVHFGHESEGGANDIRAKGVGCGIARDVSRTCLKHNAVPGWTAVNWGIRTELHRGADVVDFIGVGGGGCGFSRERCKDFSYRGVGFFGLEAVGISCGGAREKAKAWYDQGGGCRFGSTCQVGSYSCRANANTATVTCSRENGFRFRWQMGE